ncbi:hypothetical protein DFH11DRAFT_694715 [Phellopilus nigrolimitatus]|nr:hypothetical protein DFH11DRAFT_694715 [Phellopilus nigrolimitatus]
MPSRRALLTVAMMAFQVISYANARPLAADMLGSDKVDSQHLRVEKDTQPIGRTSSSASFDLRGATINIEKFIAVYSPEDQPDPESSTLSDVANNPDVDEDCPSGTSCTEPNQTVTLNPDTKEMSSAISVSVCHTSTSGSYTEAKSIPPSATTVTTKSDRCTASAGAAVAAVATHLATAPVSPS